MIADVFFQGAVDPFAGTMPGNTETGFAEAFAVNEWATVFAVATGGLAATGAAGAGLVLCGGGFGAAGGAAGGTSSR